MADFRGTSGDDTLVGSTSNDNLYGGKGHDRLTGRAGDDQIYGDGGLDTAVYSGNFADYRFKIVYEGAFTVSDTVPGRDGTDTAYYVDFFQFADGTRTADDLLANVEPVVPSGEFMTLNGQPAGALTGGTGDDTVQGGEGADTLAGGPGDDLLLASTRTYGPIGSDTAVFSGKLNEYRFDVISEGHINFSDTVPDRDGSDATFQFGFFQFADGKRTAAELAVQAGAFGTSGNDTLQGPDNTGRGLNGLAGNDTLLGGGGEDTLTGGHGNDVIDGGANNRDSAVFSGPLSDYSVHVGADGRVEIRDSVAGRDGTDSATHVEFFAFSDGSRSVADLVEYETWGIPILDGMGGTGNDKLYGGKGDDVLLGGGGSDYLMGGQGIDTASYADKAGGVTVSLALEGAQLIAPGEFETLVSIENLLGGSGADRLSGNGGANQLDGAAGDDTLSGAGGADTLIGGSGLDVAVFAGARSSHQMDVTGTSAQVVRDGATTSLQQVERVHFDDVSLALDFDGNAGAVAKILGSVLGPASVGNPLLAGIGLKVMDGGMSAEGLMQFALDAVLGADAGPDAVVDLLFTNSVGTAPSAAQHAFFTGLLTTGLYSESSLGMLAAESSVNLVGIHWDQLQKTGLAFQEIS